MTSINYNASSQVALQTLRSTNSNLSTLQQQIATGKEISTARDNASIWSIAKTQEGDVSAFNAVSESLSLASSTIGVARTASERVTDLLIEVQDLVTQAQNKSSDDRGKIQTDIDNLEAQVSDIVNASQFNGVNLLKGDESVDFLSSFNRSDSGIETATISVSRNNLEVDNTDVASISYSAGTIGTQAAIDGVNDVSTTVAPSNVNDETIFSVTTGSTVAEGDVLRISFDDGNTTTDIDYQVQAGDTLNDAVDGLIDRVNAGGIEGLSDLNRTTSGGDTVITADFASTAVFTVTQASAEGTASTVDNGVVGVDPEVDGVTNIVSTQSGTSASGAVGFVLASDADISEGDTFQITLDDGAGNNVTVEYNAGASDSASDVLSGLVEAIGSEITAGNIGGISNLAVDTTVGAGDNDFSLTFDTDGSTDIEISSDSAQGQEVATVAGNVGVDAAVTGVNSVTATVPAAETATVFSLDSGETITEGQVFRIAFDDGGTTTNVDYTATGTDTSAADIITGLTAAIGTAGIAGVSNIVSGTSGGNLTIDLDVGEGNTYSVSQDSADAVSTSTKTSAGLYQLSQIDVTTDPEGALDKIDDLINVAKDAAAAFGSDQTRFDIQQDFVAELVSSLEGGISALTDVDLTEASAELSALQVQQQLGIQSLSIANQTPQALLSLFR